MNTMTTKQNLEKTLNLLIDSHNMRPFLFRTRFERIMIRLIAYANETEQTVLADLVESSLDKMKAIIDKSNTTSDGTLRSYILLQDDMRQILQYIQS